MVKILLTTCISLLFTASFGQNKLTDDTIDVNNHIIKVTLLGTGDPQPIMERFGPSILIQAGTQTLLFDTGRGCLQRLHQINLGYDKIDALFFTHLHSDHIVGLPDLWLTGWLLSKRNVPLAVFGPQGTIEMTKFLRKAYSFDIKIRTEDDKAPIDGSKLISNDIREGVIYEKNGVKVTAFLVDHFPVVPAFGYRIEYGGYSVVLSGDTRYSENLIKYAKQTDLLVHEVVIAPDPLSKTDPKYSIFAHHTTPEQASKIFNIVKPRLAVYSHIVRLYGHTNQELLERTKVDYPGLLVLGEDLMTIYVGKIITIKAWQ
jgi:ribonuclease Z